VENGNRVVSNVKKIPAEFPENPRPGRFGKGVAQGIGAKSTLQKCQIQQNCLQWSFLGVASIF
jgi:hypothetical protein